MDYSLWLALGGLILSCLAVARTYLRAPSRELWLLTGRVEDLEQAHADVRDRLTRRAKSENMQKARDALETSRRSARDLEAEALRVIEEAKQGPQPQVALDPGSQKRALRAQLFGVPMISRKG